MGWAFYLLGRRGGGGPYDNDEYRNSYGMEVVRTIDPRSFHSLPHYLFFLKLINNEFIE